MRQISQIGLGVFALALCLAGVVEAARTVRPARADDAAIEAAIANPNRPASDREQDSYRKPDVVLKLLGARPGIRVIDYLAGDGYWTELLAPIVGPTGRVITFNNPLYTGFMGQELAHRFANHRVANSEQKVSEIADLKLPPNSLDAALFVMSYHDAYFAPEHHPQIADPPQMLRALFDAMKPGSIVVVEDHVAQEGSAPKESVQKLHRIDPAVVRKDFETAGFKFDMESDALRRSTDDHTLLVFNPKVRHQTDLFLMRFRKP